jgi:hypothetical protein
MPVLDATFARARRVRVLSLVAMLGALAMGCSDANVARLSGRISHLADVTAGATQREVIVHGTAVGDVRSFLTAAIPITIKEANARRRGGFTDLVVGDSVNLWYPPDAPIQPSQPAVYTILRIEVIR